MALVKILNRIVNNMSILGSIIEGIVSTVAKNETKKIFYNKEVDICEIEYGEYNIQGIIPKCYIEEVITSGASEFTIGEDIWYQRDDKNLRISIDEMHNRRCFLHVLKNYWDSNMIQEIVNNTDKILYILHSRANPAKYLRWDNFHVPAELELNNRKIVVVTGGGYISDIGESGHRIDW